MSNLLSVESVNQKVEKLYEWNPVSEILAVCNGSVSVSCQAISGGIKKLPPDEKFIENQKDKLVLFEHEKYIVFTTAEDHDISHFELTFLCSPSYKKRK